MQTFLKIIPKISLHLHLEGTIRPATFVELAAKHGVELPPFTDPAELYSHDNVAVFFQTFKNIRQSVRDTDDFRRITYEAIEDAAKGGVRYMEFFASTTGHLEDGIPYSVQMEGITAGIREAEVDFGVPARIISCIHRTCEEGMALEMVEMMATHRNEYLIGLGMGGDEEKAPPEKFIRAFQLAGQAGFKRTAHACERISPTREIETCLDVLGCDRIDHGYRIVFDENLARRCADQGTVFTTIPIAQNYLMQWYPDLGSEPIINRMIAQGLRVTLDTDDPAIAGIDAVNPYQMAVAQMGCGPEMIKTFMINSIEGCWADDSTKREWRQKWSTEMDADIASLEQ